MSLTNLLLNMRSFHVGHRIALTLIFSLLAVAPSMAVKGNISGTGEKSDPYLIQDVEDWNAFAAKVNAEGSMISSSYQGQFIKLCANIGTEDAPVTNKIGKWFMSMNVSDPSLSPNKPFSGTFDGGGHTITVSIGDEEGVGTALFSYIKGATIKNLTVKGTVSGKNHVAGLVGISEGSGNRIENCVVSTTVNGGTHIGGILGHGLTSDISIDNCVFRGMLVGGSKARGVFFGWGDDGGTKTVSNCLYIQQDGQGTDNLDLVKMNAGSVAVTDCYKTAEVGTYGTLAYLDAPTDAFAEEKVATDGTPFYIILKTSISGSGTEESPYIISKASQWDEFADLVSRGYTFVGKFFKLNENISVTKKVGVVKSDGTLASPFSGTFDGGGFTITASIEDVDNPGTALFSYIEEATIKNLKLAGSVSGGIHAAGLVGFSNGTGNKIENCVVSATINGGSHIGGILGHGLSSDISIDNCVFRGMLVGGETAKGIFVGWGDNGGTKTVSNCLYIQQDSQKTDNLDLVKMDAGSVAVTDCYKTANVGTYGKLVYLEIPEDEILKKWIVMDGRTFYIAGDISGVKSYYLYTGDEIGLSYKVTDPDGIELVKGEDYTATFTPSPVKDKGDYTLTITAKDGGIYTGSKTISFTVIDEIPVTATTTAMTSGIYRVSSDVTVDERIVVTGDVTLILDGGKTLTALKGIDVSSGNMLTIDGMGSLYAIGNNLSAGIGGGFEGSGGIITINGGTVTATGSDGAGIGGGYKGSGGTITINGGTVTATRDRGAGIGGGYKGSGGTITINGGTVTATGLGEGGAGIGGGCYESGGTITINGGTVTATGNLGAGIGGGYKGSGGTITINGGTVTATGNLGAGIGSGYEASASGSVTLGWTNEDDFVYANSYGGVEIIKFVDGKAFHYYEESGKGVVVENADNIGGKTLYPFDGNKNSLKNAIISGVQPSYSYTGDEIALTYKVTDVEGKELVEGADYTASLNGSPVKDMFIVKDAGEYTLTIAAKENGAYTGSKNVNFTVAKRSLENAIISGVQPSYSYTGEEIALTYKVTDVEGKELVEGADYTASLNGSPVKDVFIVKEAGDYMLTIVAKENGEYAGSKSVYFTVAKRSLENATVSGVQPCYSYTGEEISLTYKVSDFEGKELVEGTDYTASLNGTLVKDVFIVKDIGDYTFTITAKDGGFYTGSKIVSFSVVSPYIISSKKDWDDFVASVNDGETYSGKYIKLNDNISVSTKVGVRNGSQDRAFSGVFDGGGHTITADITDKDNSGTALFGYISGATIKNLTLAGKITGGIHAAGIVGYSDGTGNRIDSCIVSATIDGGTHIGGILGHGLGSDIAIDNCVFKGELVGGETAKGALFGWGDEGGSKIVLNSLYILQDNQNMDDLDLVKKDAGSVIVKNSYMAYLTAPVDDFSMEKPVWDGTKCYIVGVSISGIQPYYSYTGEEITLMYKVMDVEGKEFVEGADYTASLNGSPVKDVFIVKDAGDYTLTITAKKNGAYTGSKNVNFIVAKRSLENATISGVQPSYSYTGEEIALTYKVTNVKGEELVEGTDYTVSFIPSPVKDVGVYTLIIIAAKEDGAYTGSKSVNFVVVKRSLENATISGIQPSYSYTGDKIDLTYKVTDSDGKELVEGTDYTVSFSPSPVKNAGKYILTITAKENGAYTGSKSVGFVVFKQSLDNATVSGIQSYYLYTGNKIDLMYKVTDSDGKELVEGTDYKVSFSPSPIKDVGDYTLTIAAGKNGFYTGKKTVNFTVADRIIPVTATTTAMTNGVYVVSNDVTIDERIVVTGVVKLILEEGKTLTASEGINVSNYNKIIPSENELIIDGKGSLYAKGVYDAAGIGGDGNDWGGSITVNGGFVTATGGDNGAGIGAGNGAIYGGTITVNGGFVTAMGGYNGAGIGGGSGGHGGTITVNGGFVTATGGFNGAGIGGGLKSSNSDVIIEGGIVTATGGYNGAGIGGGKEGHGGGIMIFGGKVTANGRGLAVGMGPGFDGPTRDDFISLEGTNEDDFIYASSYGNVLIGFDFYGQGNKQLYYEENGEIIVVKDEPNIGGIIGGKTLRPILSQYSLKFAGISGIQSNYLYNGDEIELTYKVTDSEGKELVKNTDYTATVTPSPVKDAGYYTLTVTAEKNGDYFGSKTVNFTVSQQSLENTTISGIQPYYYYTGEKIELTYKVTDSEGKELVKNTDYTATVTPSPVKDVGKYTMVFTGRGNYKGTKKVKFSIVPKVILASGAIQVFEDENGKRAEIAGEYDGAEAVNITEDIKNVAVTFNREFTPNSGYATIMLPFDVNATKLTGVRSVIEFDGISKIDGKNAVGMTYVWCDATLGEQELEKGHTNCNGLQGELKAYTPYMVEMETPTLGINGNVTLKSNSGKIVGDAPVGNWVFRGTLQKKEWSKEAGIINEGRLWAFAGSARKGASIGKFVQFGGNNWANPFRAYLVECKDTGNGLDCSDEDSGTQPSLVSRYRFADALAPTNSAEKSAGAAATDQSLVMRGVAASETASIEGMDIVIVYGDKDSESDKERPTIIGRMNPATGEIRMLPSAKRTYDLKGRRVGNGKKAKGAYYRK